MSNTASSASAGVAGLQMTMPMVGPPVDREGRIFEGDRPDDRMPQFGGHS